MDLTGLYDDDTKDEDFFDSIVIPENTDLKSDSKSEVFNCDEETCSFDGSSVLATSLPPSVIDDLGDFEFPDEEEVDFFEDDWYGEEQCGKPNNITKDEMKESVHSTLSHSNSTPKQTPVHGVSSAYVGPFLGMILSRVEQMVSKSNLENLLLCQLISKLCSYNHPLLRSFLLDSALPLQPSIQNL